MPQINLPAQPPAPPPAHDKACRACGKPMRLVSVPDPRYTNLDRHNYACDCGKDTVFFVRKPDEGGH
jgi:hypothetical protein